MKKILTILIASLLILTAFGAPVKSVSADEYAEADVEIVGTEVLNFGSSYSMELEGLSGSGTLADAAFINVYEDGTQIGSTKISGDTPFEDDDDNFNIVYDYARLDENNLNVNVQIPLNDIENNDNLFEDDTVDSFGNAGFDLEIVDFRHNDDSDSDNPYSDSDDEVEIEVSYLGDVLGTEWVEEGDSVNFGNNDFDGLVKIELGSDAIKDDEPDSESDTPYVDSDSMTIWSPDSGIEVFEYEITGGGSDSDQGSDSDSDQDSVEKTQIVDNYLMFPDETLTIEGDNTYTITTTDPGLGTDQVYLQVSKNGEVIDDSISLQAYGSEKTISDGVINLALGAINAERGGYNINVFAPSQYSPQYPERESNVLMEPTLDSHEAIIGQPVQVRVGNIENTGSGDAYNLQITGPVPDGFNLEGNNVMGPVNLGSGNTHSDHTYFLIPNSAGQYEFGDVEASWSDDVESRSRTFEFQKPTLTVYGEPTLNAEAQMSVDGEELDTPSVLPGDEVTLNLNLRNVGGGPATEVGVSLNGKSRTVKSINAGGSDEVSFNYTAGEPGVKTIEASIGYKDAIGESSYSLDKSISLIVEEPPKPDLKIDTAFRGPDSNKTIDKLKVGEPYVYEVKITNNGKAKAENVVTRFNNLTKVVGTIEVNSTESTTYQYVPETEGSYNMTTDVHYEIEHSYGEGPTVLNSKNSVSVSNPPMDLDPRNLVIVLLFALAIISAAYYYKKSSDLQKDETRREDMTKEGGLPDHEKERK